MTASELVVADVAVRLGRLHVAHYARMVRRWRPVCANMADAEDLVQEAFTRLYRRYRRGDGPGDGGADMLPEGDAALVRMVHVTARRLLIDQHRAAGAVKRLDLAGHAAVAAEDDFAAEPIALDQLVEDEVAMRRLLDHLLDRLDPHWARVLALLCEDFLPAEIGVIMEGRNGHVLVRQTRVHVCRILQELAASGDDAAAWMGVRFCGWVRTAKG